MSSFTHPIWDSAWSEVAARQRLKSKTSAYKDWYDAQWVSPSDAIGGFTEGQQLKSKNPPPPDLPEEPTDLELLKKIEALGFQSSGFHYYLDPSHVKLKKMGEVKFKPISISKIMGEINQPLLLLLED